MKYIIQDIKDFLFIKRSWGYFTYIFRRPYYRLRLFKKFCSSPYYGPWELCNPMFDYPFHILCEFVEQNLKDVKYRWNTDEASEHEKEHLIYQNKCNDEIEWLYNFYTVDVPKREEEQEYLLHIWSEHYVSWWDKCQDDSDNLRGCMQYYSNPKNKYADFLHNLLHEEEEKLEQDKEDSLIRLIKIRNRLWT